MTTIEVDHLALAQLVAHALNQLDGWPEPQDDHGCCPYCCAPCAAVKTLDDAGRLDDAVRPFAERGGWIWWTEAGAVDRDWLRRAWRETDCHSLMVVDVNGVEYEVDVRGEPGTFWAAVEELPGCFASGGTPDELRVALTEAIRMWAAPAA